MAKHLEWACQYFTQLFNPTTVFNDLIWTDECTGHATREPLTILLPTFLQGETSCQSKHLGRRRSSRML